MKNQQSSVPVDPEPASAASRGILAGNLLLLLLIVVLAAIKGRSYFPDGRLWAEEGKFYYVGLAGHGPLRPLTFLYHGYLALPTNIIVWLASHAPLRVMPVFVTYPALVVQMIPAFMVMAYRQRLGIGLLPLAGWLVIYFGLPQSGEIFATAVNLHFHLVFITALVLILPTSGEWTRWVMCGLLLCSGLGGITANALTPLFLIKAWSQKDRGRWVQAAVLVGTGVLQGALLLTHSGETGSSRTFGFDPWLVVLAAGSQLLLAPLLGFDSGEGIAVLVRSALEFGGTQLPLAVLVAAAVCWLYGCVVVRSDSDARYLLAAGLIALFLGCTATLGDPAMLVSTRVHGRYFVIPNALMFLSIAGLISRSRAGMLAVFFAACVVSTGWYGVSDLYAGRPWNEAYANCMAAPPCRTIEIWPPGWVMQVPPRAEP